MRKLAICLIIGAFLLLSCCGTQSINNEEKNPVGFVKIESGTFKMGNQADEPTNPPFPNALNVHEVKLTRSFYISDHEITQSEYSLYGSYPSTYIPTDKYGLGDNYPAYWVNYNAAIVYCNKRSIAEGLTPAYKIGESSNPDDWGKIPACFSITSGGQLVGYEYYLSGEQVEENDYTVVKEKWATVTCNRDATGYRLPTEAEWEYAGRAGNIKSDASVWSGTSDEASLGDYAWTKDNSENLAHATKTKKANEWGVYDMSGNVWELVEDWLKPAYAEESETDPLIATPLIPYFKIRRGGSCFAETPKMAYLAVNYRKYMPFDSVQFNTGFRVVRTCK